MIHAIFCMAYWSLDVWRLREKHNNKPDHALLFIQWSLSLHCTVSHKIASSILYSGHITFICGVFLKLSHHCEIISCSIVHSSYAINVFFHCHARTLLNQHMTNSVYNNKTLYLMTISGGRIQLYISPNTSTNSINSETHKCCHSITRTVECLSQIGDSV